MPFSATGSGTAYTSAAIADLTAASLLTGLDGLLLPLIHSFTVRYPAAVSVVSRYRTCAVSRLRA